MEKRIQLEYKRGEEPARKRMGKVEGGEGGCRGRGRGRGNGGWEQGGEDARLCKRREEVQCNYAGNALSVRPTPSKEQVPYCSIMAR